MEAMSNSPNNPRDQLERLADALAEDVLNASDEDILAEADEDHGDAAAQANALRALAGRTMLESAKAKMQAAKEAVRAAKSGGSSNVIDLPLARKQALFDELIAGDPQLREKLTRAARKQDELTERDVDSVLEALRDLGLIDDEGNPR